MFRLLAALVVTTALAGAAPSHAQTTPTEAPKTTETKPGDAKPAETKPAEAKPAEAKPGAKPPATLITGASTTGPNQFGTFVAQCEKARGCIRGTKADCVEDAYRCVAMLEGMIGTMRQACLQRKTNSEIPTLLTVGQPKSISDMIDAVAKYSKEHAGDNIKHKVGQTMLALTKAFPCEN